jgi:hypothetical protein
MREAEDREATIATAAAAAAAAASASTEDETTESGRPRRNIITKPKFDLVNIIKRKFLF